MKASVVLPGIVALSTLLVASSQAATPTAVAWIIAADATGQAAGAQTAPAADPRRQSDDLLRQAQRALKEGQFDQADSLIAQAEKLGVKYDPVWDRFANTPATLKKLAAEERAKGKSPAKPSSLFPAFLTPGDKQPSAAPQPPQDPFAARNARENTVNQITAGSAPQNNPTAPFLQNPADMAASDNRALPLLPGGQAPPAAVGPQPGVNPYALPAEANPLTRGAELPAAAPQQFTPPQFVPPGASPQENRPTPEQLADLNLPAAREPGRPDESPQRLPVPPFSPGQPTVGPTAGGAPNANKAEAQRLVAEARMALDKGDLNAASNFAKQADALRVPDTMFAAGETRPWEIFLEIDKAAYRRQGVQPAGGVQAAGSGPQYPVQPGVFNQGGTDPSRIQPASALSNAMVRQAPESLGASHPLRLYEEGIKALEGQDRDGALRKFLEAWKQADQLDPEMRAALKDKLTFLRAANAAPAQPLPRPDAPAAPLPLPNTAPNSSPTLEAVGSQQEVARQRLQREFANEQKAAEQLAQTDPRAALAKIKAFRERVVAAEIDTNGRKNLLTLVDRRAAELQTYIDNNRSTIDNAEKNRAVLADRARDQEVTLEVQEKIATMVEQFNKLMDDRRYAEALVIAKQARELAPNEAVVVLMIEKGTLATNMARQSDTRRNKENYVQQSLQEVEDSAAGNVGDEPIVFNPRRWGELTRRRRSMLEQRTRLSPAEQEIQKSLSKPVEVKFVNRPLNEVVNVLSQMTGVNIYLDPQGLHAEGVTVDTPVTLDLSMPISLKSALNLLLEPKGLSYVIQNEVLRVTSRSTRDSNVFARVYYVADLVIPIPNFTPTYNMGIAGALKESLSSLGYGGNGSPLGRAPLTVAKDTPGAAGGMNPAILGQQAMSENGLFPTQSSRNPGMSAGGPGGMGGGVQADFDPLIDLITSTIEPDSWQDVGGPGSISGFDTNLSLVVSQRQDIHERIADLLEQLRRLQDLQVTIEVRFITVSDRFFERIGIDFDFNVDDNTHLNNRIDQIPTPQGSQPLSPFDDDYRSFSVGLTPTGPTADLDFRFNQGGFTTAVPQFGGFDAGSAANFGFAILSDIEVFMLLQAAQGDDRTNVLQAPKVTLFNGQQATIIDSSFRPFVTSVIPVVGDFAAAHQPVIVVLSEGTMMSVQAVVSSDRRFVRLTLVPFFSQIGDVETFTFTGSVTTNSGTVIQDPSNPDQNAVSGATRTVSGTTVQLPTLATTTVTTTVSVPDGGTVLLGGIKRLREGRVERGLPLVSKIPYVSRLFTNVGIGRDAQSLMMMVTPRIIIQEEEEEKLGIDFEE